LSENIITWEFSRLSNSPKSTLVSGSFSPGRDYPRLGENISSPGWNQFKEHTCSRAILAWATVPSLGRNYFLVLDPGTPLLSGFQVTLSGWDCLTWAGYSENNNLSYKSYNSYYLRAITCVSNELIEQKLTCIPIISTKPHHTWKNQITTRI